MLLLAGAFLLDGVSGLMLSRTAKADFHRCFYIMIERFFGGDDLMPDNASLESGFVYFNFAWSLQKMLLVALSFLLIQRQQMDTAAMLAIGLITTDCLFFTNPMA